MLALYPDPLFFYEQKGIMSNIFLTGQTDPVLCRDLVHAIMGHAIN